MDWIDILGYFAMGLVVISIMMTKIFWLRIFNMAGALTFIFYGLLIDSYPILILNVILTFVNLYHLMKMKKKESSRQ